MALGVEFGEFGEDDGHLLEAVLVAFVDVGRTTPGNVDVVVTQEGGEDGLHLVEGEVLARTMVIA